MVTTQAPSFTCGEIREIDHFIITQIRQHLAHPPGMPP